MSFFTTDDGVSLFYDEVGTGAPVVFVHEFAGDSRSWEPQLRHFSRKYRCIVFNARGYPPSAVPDSVDSYSQERAAADIACVLDHLGLPRAHVVGFSMGAFAALQFGISYPARALSLCLAGCGYGAEIDQQEKFKSEALTMVESMLGDGMERFAERYVQGPSRVQYEHSDPRGFAEFKARLAGLDAKGLSNTQLGVQCRRPSLYNMNDALAQVTAPTLVLSGDEDWPCLKPSIHLKRHIATAAMAVVPNTGHNINLESAEAFNGLVGGFLDLVAAGRWPSRDPRAMSTSIVGMEPAATPSVD
uniref:alpha/beta fold hydrolase n=1 Tax=Variovorax sp. BK018 TaxID=3450241 RepID=UPI00403A047F